jgi:hypothetical protein
MRFEAEEEEEEEEEEDDDDGVGTLNWLIYVFTVCSLYPTEPNNVLRDKDTQSCNPVEPIFSKSLKVYTHRVVIFYKIVLENIFKLFYDSNHK